MLDEVEITEPLIVQPVRFVEPSLLYTLADGAVVVPAVLAAVTARIEIACILFLFAFIGIANYNLESTNVWFDWVYTVCKTVWHASIIWLFHTSHSLQIQMASIACMTGACVLIGLSIQWPELHQVRQRLRAAAQTLLVVTTLLLLV